MTTLPRTATTTTTFEMALIGARRYEPEHRVHRVGQEYEYTDPVDSIASAICGLLTAHHRLTFPGRGAAARVNWWWLAERVRSAGVDPWGLAVAYLRVGSIPFEDTDMGLAPVSTFQQPRSADEVAQAIIFRGPVVLYTPWPARFEEASNEYGVDWVGPEGRALAGPWYADYRRAVLLKGVSYRYRAFRVQDDRRDDLWFPFTAFDSLLREGAEAVGIVL